MLNPNSSVVKFGNETSKEVTEIKWSHKGGTPRGSGSLLEKTTESSLTHSLHENTPREDHMCTQTEGSHLLTKEGGLTTNPAGTLLIGFQSLEQ